MYEIYMPKLSDTMTTGRIVKWRVALGQSVREGEVLAEIESDKAVMELPCFRDGVIGEILLEEGGEAPISQVIARFVDPVEDPAAAPKESGTDQRRQERQQAAPPRADQPGPSGGALQKAPTPTPAPESSRPRAAEPKAPGAERQAISPYALRLAAEKGIDPAKLKGTGPGGRVTARDVESALAAQVERSAKTPPPGQEPPAGAPKPAGGDRPQPPAASASASTQSAGPQEKSAAGRVDRLAKGLADKLGVEAGKLSGTGTAGRVTGEDVLAAARSRGASAEGKGKAQTAAGEELSEELPPLEVSAEEAEVSEAPFRLRTMARRVTMSARSIPHFFVTRSADVAGLLEREKELRESAGVTFTHLVMFAALKALARHPEANRSYDRGRIIAWKHVNLGLAVATDEGLTVAVLRDAARLPLGELAARTRELVDRARSGRLAPEDRAHATFTVSNLGMYGVEHFQPVINPPSAVTLAVGAALESPVVRSGRLAVGRVVRLTAACDHRVLDGVAAAEFLKDLAGLLESPEALLAEERG